MTFDWSDTIVQQLTWHWEVQLRPRLDGLTDEEYFWEPVPGAWNLVPRDQAGDHTMALGTGELVMQDDELEPTPPPVTTIAWRIGHVLADVFGRRNDAHFGVAPRDAPLPSPSVEPWRDRVWPTTAAEALRQLDDGYAAWIAGTSTWDTTALTEPTGDAERFPDAPRAALVLHIQRELIHHGAEICLLRDLYAHRAP